MTRTGPFSLGK